MKSKLIVLISIILLALSAVVAIAETTNNPNTDTDANACYAGGTLAGTCDSMDVDDDGDIDQNDKDWMWKCGYYLIRVEHGIYSSDILDGICMDIEEVIIEEEDDDKKEEKSKETDDSDKGDTDLVS